MTIAAKSSRPGIVRDAKRGIILDAALKVFEREGLEGASMRAIGEAAGYTAAALYFHFASKEEVYAALLERSLTRLIAKVEEASAAQAEAPAQLAAAAMAFFDFYAENPRDLDLGFYLFRGGMRPRGLAPATDAALNGQLAQSLAPVTTALRALGSGAKEAQALTADIFAHAVGLLVMEHTGRIRMFKAQARKLMLAHVGRIIAETEQGA